MAESSFFDPDLEYRLKPKTIRIGEFEVPEPVREPLENGQEYFHPRLSGYGVYYLTSLWSGEEFDWAILNQGLMHLDPKSAELHARALIALTAK
ncbi:hypothetical protein ID856_18230 [Xenorhabdus sp. 18]|nr:hypothetical protein [Xenorhabdus sp. 18]